MSPRLDVRRFYGILTWICLLGYTQAVVHTITRPTYTSCTAEPTTCTYKLVIASGGKVNNRKSRVMCDAGGPTVAVILMEYAKYTFRISHTLGGKIKGIKTYITKKAPATLVEVPDCSHLTTTTVGANETTVPSWTSRYCLSEGGDPCIIPYVDANGKNWTVCEPNGFYYKCAIAVDDDGTVTAYDNCAVDGSCPLDGYETTPGEEIKGCSTVDDEICVFPFKTACCTDQGLECVFPFKWKDVEYNECSTKDSSPTRPWCATAVKDDGNLEASNSWGYCVMDVCTPPIAPPAEHTGCVESTVEGNEGMGWCATSIDNDTKIFTKWGYCMIPDCTQDGVAGMFTTGTTISLDGDCGCDIPSSCISKLFGALMGPLEKLAEMMTKVFDMFGSLLGRKIRNRLIGNQWEVATEALIMNKTKTNCDVLANMIAGGLLDIAAQGRMSMQEIEMMKRDVKEARERGLLGGLMDIIVAMGIAVAPECKCTCGCQAYPEGGGLMSAFGRK